MVFHRRLVLRLLCATSAFPMAFIPREFVGSRVPTSMPATRIEKRNILARVVRWGCQYQNIRVQDIAGSPLDLIVVEPILDATTGRTASTEELHRLKSKGNGERRLVLAYLSVGAAEEYRPYWSPDWKVANSPAWLGVESRDWPRSYSVRYWHPEWRKIVIDATVRLVDVGFDGIFLDRVDGFHDWRGVRASALDDMADLVADIADSARSRNSGFLLIGQNAEPLLVSRRYLNAIDAVSKESSADRPQGT